MTVKLVVNGPGLRNDVEIAGFVYLLAAANLITA